MKQNFALAVITALITTGLGSCSKVLEPSGTNPVSGDFMKPFSISFNDISVKSTTAAPGESSMNEATVFVYQKTGAEGTETLYKTIHTASESVDVDLLFNSSTEYRYRFDAYANMGSLVETPSEVLFSRESSECLQMHGELSDITQSSASYATVSMERYVGRIVIESVRLNWKQIENCSQDFILKRIWLANSAEVHGGSPAYNINGNVTESDMNHFLVSEVNETISDGQTYKVPHYLYGYASDETAIVLECEWAGRTMYYHVDCELSPNRSLTMSLNIHQTGADEPLGEITDDALTKVGSLNVSDWNNTDSDIRIGEERYPGAEAPSTETALILRTNGRFYTADEWNEMNVDDAEAVGVAISDGIHSLAVHPYEFNAKRWDSDYTIPDFEGISMTGSKEEAASDFNGKANTDAMLAAVESGVLTEAPMASVARKAVFANGAEGYVPAAGELVMIRNHYQSFRKCVEAVGGNADDVYRPFSSTFYSNVQLWQYSSYDGELVPFTIVNGSIDFYVVCAL